MGGNHVFVFLDELGLESRFGGRSKFVWGRIDSPSTVRASFLRSGCVLDFGRPLRENKPPLSR